MDDAAPQDEDVLAAVAAASDPPPQTSEAAAAAAAAGTRSNDEALDEGGKVGRPKLVTPTNDAEGTSAATAATSISVAVTSTCSAAAPGGDTNDAAGSAAAAAGGADLSGGAAAGASSQEIRRPQHADALDTSDRQGGSDPTRGAASEPAETRKTKGITPNQPDYMKITVDNDSLSSFQLRTKLSHLNFTDEIYSVMRDVGWKYTGGRYYSPSGLEFQSAKELTEFLDRFGMPERGSEPLYPPVGPGGEEGRRGRRLRDDLLGAVFRHGEYQRSRKRRRKRGKGDADGGGAADQLAEDGVSGHNGNDEHGGGGGGSVGLFDLDSWASGPKKEDDDINATNASKGATTKLTTERKNAATATSIDPGARQCFEGARRGGSSRTRSKKATLTTTARANKKKEKADTVENASIEKPAYQVWPDPQRCVEEVRSLLANESSQRQADDDAAVVEDAVVEELNELEAGYEHHFEEWRFLLTTNHSLLLYGFGSKRVLLDRFSDAELAPDGDVLTLDGFDRDVSIDRILDVIVGCYLDGREPPRGGRDVAISSPPSPPSSTVNSLGLGMTQPTPASPPIVRRAASIARRIATTRPQPLFIVLHNVDGAGLRNRVAQEALATLVSCSSVGPPDTDSSSGSSSRMVRMVASVDHVNSAALLWDTRTVTNFAWVWKEARTYRPYYEEVRLGAEAPTRKVKFAQTAGGGRSSSADHGDGDGDMGFLRVLRSLGPRNAECLQALARLQLARGDGDNKRRGGGGSKSQQQQQRRQKRTSSGTSSSASSSAVPYRTWFDACSRGMSVANDTSLRLVLRELVDHGIVQERTDEADGAKLLFVPHKEKVLDQILDFQPNRIDD